VVRLPFIAVVFDCDGVLVDSAASVESAWRELCRELDLPADEILPTIHGIRAADTLRRWVRPDRVAAAVTRLEELELEAVPGTPAVPGALALAAFFDSQPWAVATSGSRMLASARLAAAGFPMPAVLISADDVRRGKPDPDPYLAAAAALGVEPVDIVVFEDSPTGAASAHAAGARVVAVATTFPAGSFAAEATVADLRHVAVDGTDLVIS
jgi:mannitol-1-/sugar-/sorbitol-6-phosphatase